MSNSLGESRDFVLLEIGPSGKTLLSVVIHREPRKCNASMAYMTYLFSQHEQEVKIEPVVKRDRNSDNLTIFYTHFARWNAALIPKAMDISKNARIR